MMLPPLVFSDVIFRQAGKAKNTLAYWNPLPMAQCYKNLSVCDLQMFVVSYVCPWHAFPSQSKDSQEDQERAFEWSNCKLLHSVRL